MLMANAVSQLAAKTPGKEAAAMEAFAAALRQVQAKLYNYLHAWTYRIGMPELWYWRLFNNI